jgi:hypothetical protein
MALIVPTGVPAWLRTASIADYGGHTSKENYLSRGAIDALTDVGAEDYVRATADLASVVRTNPFAVIYYLNNDGSLAAPTIWSVLMMTGVRFTSYPGDSAPSGFPSAARQGTGEVTFTFDASYLDDYGVSGAFAPIMAKGTGASGTTLVAVTTEIAGATVNVRCFDDAGSAVADKYVTLLVW